MSYSGSTLPVILCVSMAEFDHKQPGTGLLCERYAVVVYKACGPSEHQEAQLQSSIPFRDEVRCKFSSRHGIFSKTGKGCVRYDGECHW